MTIQFISDIHGDAADLRRALDSFAGENPDLIVLCGDYLNHGPRNPLPDGWSPKEVADILNAISQKIVAVRGNCDCEVDEMMLNFPCLCASTNIFVQNRRIFVHHGHLYDRKKLSTWLPCGTLVVSGHTHVALFEEENGIFYLNPGSISLPKSQDGKTFASLKIESNANAQISLCSISSETIWTKNLWT